MCPQSAARIQLSKTIMKSSRPPQSAASQLSAPISLALLPLALAFLLVTAAATESSHAPPLEAGIAVRDVTPKDPIWLAGYAARNRPSERVDSPLVLQAVAFRSGLERVVFVCLDNCGVSRAFTEPVLRALDEKHGLGPGRVMIVSSHTHSGPVLESNLSTMYNMSPDDLEITAAYGRLVRETMIEAVGAALEDLQPALLEHGVTRATFAMNRRVYQEDRIAFGENPDGPVDWDVPVLKIKWSNGETRGIMFGYACHATSIAGDDFYAVSGDYIGYARQHLESLHPGATAAFLTGMGADSNPSPRGSILNSKRHGLELAGAVSGTLSRPMRPVRGALKFAFEELDLPLEAPPTREQLETDAQSSDVYIQRRAQAYLAKLERGEALPVSVKLPMGMARIGDDLTFVAMGGEVVVDYSIRLKRLLAADHPWLIGFAYEVPCYIPSIRIIKEGGYEAQSSLIYYGLYGPFRTATESIILKKAAAMAGSLRP
jgi:neutral ceramidase